MDPHYFSKSSGFCKARILNLESTVQNNSIQKVQGESVAKIQRRRHSVCFRLKRSTASELVKLFTDPPSKMLQPFKLWSYGCETCSLI